LQTGLRLRDINATMTLKKSKGSYDSGRNYKIEWEMTIAWVQISADASICQL